MLGCGCGGLFDNEPAALGEGDILGVQIPSITLPVCPGRNIAVVLEIAAMNHRQKMMGYNTAEEFNRRLMAKMGMSQEDIDAASTPKV